VRYVPGVGAEITISISHTRLTGAARVILYALYHLYRIHSTSRCRSRSPHVERIKARVSRHAAADGPSLAIRALQAERDECAPTQATQDSTNERIRLARN